MTASIAAVMVNKNPPPDERVVYLAFKNVFKGQEAGIRQIKAVKKLVQENRQQENVAGLLDGHGLDVVCNSAKTLLNDEVFASTLKAKIRFPELFDLSPTQTAEREASEAEAARCEASAIENAVKGRQQDMEISVAGPSTMPVSKSKPLFCGRYSIAHNTRRREEAHGRCRSETASTGQPGQWLVLDPPSFPDLSPFECSAQGLESSTKASRVSLLSIRATSNA